ncbi:MAG: SNF2-related protein [Pseudomonadota bacterium]
MPPETAKNNQIEGFSRVYPQLLPQAKIILQLLSIVYAGISKTTLEDCLTTYRIQGLSLDMCTPRALKPAFRELASNNLIEERGQYVRCLPAFLHEATRKAIEGDVFETMAMAVEETTKYTAVYYNGRYANYDYCVRDIRIAVYRRDFDAVRGKMQICAEQFPENSSKYPPLYLICANPFDPGWIITLPEALITDVLGIIFSRAFETLEETEAPLALLEGIVGKADTSPSVELRELMARQLIVRGQFAQARTLVENQETPRSRAFLGWLDFLSGEDEKAIAHYQTALALLKKTTGKRKIFFADASGIFYILALLRSGDPACLDAAEDYITYILGKETYKYSYIYWLLLMIVRVQKGQVKSREIIKEDCTKRIQADPLTLFFQALVLFWVDPESAKNRIPFLHQLLARVKQAGYEWLASETALILEGLGQITPEAEKAGQIYKENRITSMVRLVSMQESWELVLNALIHLRKAEDKQESGLPQARLVWLVELRGDSLSVQPLEQRRTGGGRWSKGRSIALKRLKEEAVTFGFLTDQDMRICSCIKQERFGYYGRESYEVDLDKAIPAMVGHPLLLLDLASDLRLELVRGEPELVITRDGNKLDVRLSPAFKDGAGISLVRESATRVKVIEPSKDHLKIASILREGMSVPLKGKDKVLKAVESISSMITVHSDVGMGKDSMKTVPADHRAHMVLRPFGRGLSVELLVRPFSSRGSYYRPGMGGETIIAEFDGERVQVRRNADAERENARQAVSACPILEGLDEDTGEWKIENPEDCLELLLDLQALGDKVAPEWPEGERFKIRSHASMSQLKVSIRQAKEWFSITGELRVDESLVLDMQRLMQLAGETGSRFISLGEGEFLALTEEFRKRIDELRAFAEVHEKQVRFHPLAAPAMQDFAAAAGNLKVDGYWKDHVKRMEEAQNLRPQVPSTLRAELRDYQVEGFNWLARLAHWGVGACLADDMGLGKTLQALAQILTRAPEGPSLVVAPTSVCMNWESEVRRFAPTLNSVIFGGSQRRQMLDSLQPFNLVICSYSLLQQEAEMLAEVYWQTIVLDEAQAIKKTWRPNDRRPPCPCRAGLRWLPPEHPSKTIWARSGIY